MSSRGINEQLRRRLVLAAMDAYRDWRDECSAVSHAYRRWATAGEPDSQLAWQVYEAALDREQRASLLYAHRVHQVDGLGSHDVEPAADLAA
jgi:hypothetical protein